MEDDVIAAIKVVRPGHLDSENAVVIAADRYYAAAKEMSHSMRHHVERFLFGACIGNYYVPHVLRQRVAEFSGLIDSVVAEDKLRPWEREFILRFDESEVLEELLHKAANRGNPTERAIVCV